MRLRAVWAEARANLASGTTRAALLACVFVLLVGGLAAVDTMAVSDVVADATAFRSAGAATQRLTATGAIDGRQCAALEGTAPIQGVGALRSGDALRVLTMPDTQISTWEVTPGAVRMLPAITDTRHDQAGGGAGGVWLSADLADVLGVGPGSPLATSEGTTRVAGVYEWTDDGRARDLGFTILVPVPPEGFFDACWADVWPQDQEATGLLYLALAGDPQEAQLAQLNGSLGARLNPVGALGARVTRHASVMTVLLGAAVGWGAVRLRRLEIASALHARVQKPDLVAQHMIEALGWLVPAAVVAVAVVVGLAAVADRSSLHDVAAIGAAHVVAGVGGALLATVLAVLLCREKHLFDLFKSR